MIHSKPETTAVKAVFRVTAYTVSLVAPREAIVVVNASVRAFYVTICTRTNQKLLFTVVRAEVETESPIGSDHFLISHTRAQ